MADISVNNEVIAFNKKNRFSRDSRQLSKKAQKRIIPNAFCIESGAIQSASGCYYLDTILPESDQKVRLHTTTINGMRDGIKKAKKDLTQRGLEWTYDGNNDMFVDALRRNGVVVEYLGRKYGMILKHSKS